jgi:hypothetical protein
MGSWQMGHAVSIRTLAFSEGEAPAVEEHLGFSGPIFIMSIGDSALYSVGRVIDRMEFPNR